ncbi:MAG: four helix bundle protein [Flexilinea sp.]|nr:four helix bundle protein [Flexilinea sp.]
MAISNFKDLKVWQKSIELSFMVYRYTKELPSEELYGLSSQMRRAVVSIPSNIAEGYQRSSTKEYIHFLLIAKGSLGELETQLILCEGLGYLNKEKVQSAMDLCDETGRMLTTLIRNLQQKL